MGPRFTIRTALVGLTLAAGFSLVLAQVVRGQVWAISVVVGLASLLAVFPFYTAWLVLVRLVGAVLTPGKSAAAASKTPTRGDT